MNYINQTHLLLYQIIVLLYLLNNILLKVIASNAHRKHPYHLFIILLTHLYTFILPTTQVTQQSENVQIFHLIFHKKNHEVLNHYLITCITLVLIQILLQMFVNILFQYSETYIFLARVSIDCFYFHQNAYLFDLYIILIDVMLNLFDNLGR